GAGLPPHGQPCPEAVGDLLPEGKHALLAALAAHEHVDVATAEGDVVEPDADELGDAQPAGDREVAERAVPDPVARRRVRGVEQCLLLGAGKVAADATSRPPQWTREA